MISLRLVLFLFFTFFAFLGGYLLANYHRILHHNESPCPSTETKNPEEGDKKIRTNSLRTTNTESSGSSSSSSEDISALITSTPPIHNTSSLIPRFSYRINPFYEKKINGISQPRVLTEVFWMFHHPGSPLTSEVVFQARPPLRQDGRGGGGGGDLYDNCKQVFLTRTGSLYNMPNKCLSISFVAPDDVDPIPHYHRRGKIAGMVDMYQQDFIKSGALITEKRILPPFLEHLQETIAEFLKIAGNPIRPDGSRRSVMVMVLNEGVLDLFLNFICSCKSAGIEEIFEDLVVILGQDYLIPILHGMGIKAFYSPYLGPIPQKAADFYGDLTFGILMWFKITSVYLASKAGFHVLFQVREKLSNQPTF